MSTPLNIISAADLTMDCAAMDQTSGIHLGTVTPLAASRVHEALGPSAHVLALALAGSVQSLTFWIARNGRAHSLRARAVRPFFDATHLVCVETASRQESLWAMEEALRCSGAGLVIMQVSIGPDLFESRRLQIAAQSGKTTGLVLIDRRAQSSAAQTRWHCEPVPGSGNTFEDGSETGSDQDWSWELTKNKQGRLVAWTVRGDPRPSDTHPLDLIPRSSIFEPASAPFQDARIRLTTNPRTLVSPASNRPVEPA